MKVTSTDGIPRVSRCHDCGCALTHDQRYCLECGAPRAHARAELETLYAPAAPPPPPPRPPLPPAVARGWFGITPLGLVWGVAATACAFIVGLVLGLVVNADDPQPVAQQPPVVNLSVPTPAPVAAPPVATPDPASTPEPESEPPKPDKDAKRLGKDDLEKQQEADPEAFQKESKKLDKAATEGEPPAEDGGQPGGENGDDDAMTFE